MYKIPDFHYEKQICLIALYFTCDRFAFSKLQQLKVNHCSEDIIILGFETHETQQRQVGNLWGQTWKCKQSCWHIYTVSGAGLDFHFLYKVVTNTIRIVDKSKLEYQPSWSLMGSITFILVEQMLFRFETKVSHLYSILLFRAQSKLELLLNHLFGRKKVILCKQPTVYPS